MTNDHPTTSVLFICLGNICRSPMAEAIFRKLVQDAGLAARFEIDSAGTGNWHVGSPPHHGTQAILRKNGVSFDGQRARQIQPVDLGHYDYLIVMDSSNLDDVQALVRRHGTGGQTPVIARLLDYADPSIAGRERNVPDPYYTGNSDYVFELVTSGCQGLLKEIAQ